MENSKLIRKTRIRLTFLCAGIAIVIVSAMSFYFLHISEQNLYANQVLAFENTSASLFYNISQQTVIRPRWLENLEQNGNVFVQIRDNGKDYLYNNKTKGTSIGEIFDMVYEKQEEQPDFPLLLSQNGTGYLTWYNKIVKENGFMEVTVVYPLKDFQAQLASQKRTFLQAVLWISLLLVLISFYLTGRLLKPIQINQKNQNYFISSASHELRTPLSVILSCANACRMAEDPERNRFLNTIETEGLRMSHLITDLLPLAKTDALTYTIQKESCDPDALLLDSYDAFRIPAHEKGISLNITLPEQIAPACNLDKRRIAQVLAILIQNAISYTPSGGCIHLSRLFKNGKLYFIVSDNGIGIPDQEKKEIFKKFYRGDVSRRDPGHFGLGLSIGYEIVKAHGGKLSVADTPGGGSTFRVELPGN